MVKGKGCLFMVAALSCDFGAIKRLKLVTRLVLPNYTTLRDCKVL